MTDEERVALWAERERSSWRMYNWLFALTVGAVAPITLAVVLDDILGVWPVGFWPRTIVVFTQTLFFGVWRLSSRVWTNAAAHHWAARNYAAGLSPCGKPRGCPNCKGMFDE